jgi:DNA-binding MarR family transcriptional regulator
MYKKPSQEPNSIEQEIIMLSYGIVRSVSRTMQHNDLLDHELSMLQMRTLMIISDTTITMTDLAKELNIKLPTMTTLIDRLYLMCLIERVDDPTDRRKVLIKLTAKGRRNLAKSTKNKLETTQHVLSAISDKDKQTLFEILSKMQDKLDKERK